MASPSPQNQPGGSGGFSGASSAVSGSGSGGFDMNKFFNPSTSPLTMMQPHQTTAGVGGGGNLITSPSVPLPQSSPPFIAPTSSYPPPTGPYQLYNNPHYLSPYPHQPPPQLHPYFSNLHHQQNRPPSPNTGGAVLMDILTQNPQPSSPLPTNPSAPLNTIPFPSPTSAAANAPVPSAPPVSLASPTQQTGNSPIRMLSTKVPRGRHLVGNSVVYDIDVRLQGEVQPQLEVTPITKYFSDPGLLLGRQIAVNKNYICYGLKPGSIRILNINTALRSLLRGHTQKVSDMAFFAEDVHLLASACVEGRFFIRKINEGPDEEEKPQIFEKIVLALQITGMEDAVRPRVCWHPHKQEILMIATGNQILKFDTNRLGKGRVFTADDPIQCHINNLIDGVQFMGKHDGQVTDLSMCQWMTTRLASASADGMVKIWEDRKPVPLAILRPHDGNPVNSATFLTAPDRPDHIVLMTGGPLNQELKVWTSASEEGWLLPSDTESWQSTQTLVLKSSAASSVEDAFFNQVVALPRAGLFLLANAKKNAIYAVHIDYGPYPAATRMDYIAEFTVTMPILSFTGTSDILPNGEHIIQLYCVQTQAIQQYALDLSQCLPPPLDTVELEKTESNVSHALGSANYDASTVKESVDGSKSAEAPFVSSTSSRSAENATVVSQPEGLAGSVVNSSPETASSVVEPTASAIPYNSKNISSNMPPLPVSPRLSRRLSGVPSPSASAEHTSQLSDYGANEPVKDYLMDQGRDSKNENPVSMLSSESLSKSDQNVVQTDITVVPEPPVMFKHPTHLVTPSEILSRATSSDNVHISHGMNVEETKVQQVIVNNDVGSVEVEVKEVGEMGTDQSNGFDLHREVQMKNPVKAEKSFYSQASDLSIHMPIDSVESYGSESSQQVNEGNLALVPDGLSNSGEDEERDVTKETSANIGKSETSVSVPQAPASATKAKKHKGKNTQAVGQSFQSPSPFNSTDSSNEPGCSSAAQSSDVTLSQFTAMQDTLEQLVAMQKEMQKQMNVAVSASVSKEAKRLETSVGRSIEKVAKANSDALWARIQEEYAKHEKLERDRVQQITNLLTNCMNKDLPATFEKSLKKEIAAIGNAVARAITPVMEKSVSSAITESFQKGVGEKALNQLEKLISSKLEATVARLIQAQFQTSGKQALQDSLRSTMETSVIPAFEMSCKTMFDQVDAAFQKGLTKHLTAAQQQFDSTHSSLAVALRDALNSASSLTQTLSGELADGQRKLLTIASSGANGSVGNPSTIISNGPLAHEMVELPVDPTKELSRLIAEHKYEEAFTAALHRSDVWIVSWLCSQVDLPGLLAVNPLPLSQGVLLALLQQLACDINNETSRKLAWMREVAVAINPGDHMIALHVRPIFDQVYQVLNHQRNLTTTSGSDASSIRLLMHVINSLLMSCK